MTESLQSRSSYPGDDLTDEEFTRLTSVLTEHMGMLFPKHKRREFQIKLAPYLEELTTPQREGLVRAIESSDKELQQLINRLTIGESYFFRNRPHFTALEERIIPELIRKNEAYKRLKIWCAGCSTGEEPYSLAILIKDRFPQLADWTVDIYATDINTSFLEKARRAIYTRWSFRNVEPEIISRHFVMEEENRYKLKTETITSVNFDTFNLSRTPFRDRLDHAPFDLVMCRNVLIYFSYEVSNQIIEALRDVIAQNGFLVVGHAESFPALRDLEAIYSHATYFYQRQSGIKKDRFHVQPVHTLSIPGLGVHEVERKSVIPEFRDPTVVPEPTVDMSTATTGESSLDFALEAAQDHTEMGELDVAGTMLDDLLMGPGKLDHRVHFLKALVADQENRIPDALASLKQAIFLKKTFAIGHYYHAVICEREGDGKTAARYFKNVTNITGGFPDDYELDEGGGMTAHMLHEIATERIKEVALEAQNPGARAQVR